MGSGSSNLSWSRRRNSSPPERVLDDLSLEAVANYIKSGKCKNIVTMIGAGISTAAGIPDFRSPGSGLYDNLGKYNLPFPQAMFEIHYFKRHPEPFFDIARQLIDREYRPTKAHYFIKLLHDKGLLLRNYSQNVDGLEILAGVPEDKNIEAHGTIRSSTCMKCKASYSMDEMKAKLLDGTESVPRCEKKEACQGVIKPDVVLFGESLPRSFSQHSRPDMSQCDLLIIMGTSLQVAPFCNLPRLARSHSPRLLINLQKVGQDPNVPSGFLIRWAMGIKDPGLDFDSDNAYRDVFEQTTCDDGVQQLAKLLNWSEELDALEAESHKHSLKF